MTRSDPYHLANLRGYRDGCDGKKPPDTTQAHDIPPEREEVAGGHEGLTSRRQSVIVGT
jgi:hypothetical protein